MSVVFFPSLGALPCWNPGGEGRGVCFTDFSRMVALYTQDTHPGTRWNSAVHVEAQTPLNFCFSWRYHAPLATLRHPQPSVTDLAFAHVRHFASESTERLRDFSPLFGHTAHLAWPAMRQAECAVLHDKGVFILSWWRRGPHKISHQCDRILHNLRH